MGNGIVNYCCKRVENEPEISSCETKKKIHKKNSFNRNLNTISSTSILQNTIIDDKTYFLNKVKKIGNIINLEYFDNLPKKIQDYIDANPYEELDKKFSEYATNSYTEVDNIYFSQQIQLKNNNIIYIGEWTKEGIINGRGKMYRPDIETFIEGEWCNGSLKYGRIINNSSVYIGCIEDNQFHGKGKYIDFMGNTYEGLFSFGKKHGEGKFIYSDGCTYEGNFQNDEMDGQGEFNWINGINYKGEFSKGIFHGNGILKWRNGNIYNGEFKNGFFHGNGIFYWKKEEEYYKGVYLDNNKNGKGLYKFKNGDIYIGQWSNNKPSGKGNYETKNKIYSGIWKDGSFLEVLDIVSKYQSGEIKEKINFNFEALKENIDISTLEHINIKMMIEIN